MARISRMIRWRGGRWFALFFGKRAGVAVVAGEIFVDRVDVEEAVAFRVQLFELFTAALRQDGVAGVAIQVFRNS